MRPETIIICWIPLSQKIKWGAFTLNKPTDVISYTNARLCYIFNEMSIHTMKIL